MALWTDSTTGIAVGYDDVGSGNVVALLHPFPFDRSMWAPQIAELSKTYRAIAPDTFGFGESGMPPKAWSMESMADLLNRFFDGLKLAEPFVLGGLSMGGYIALAFAKKYSKRLRGLILADTRADADDKEAKAKRSEAMELVRSQGVEALMEGMRPRVLCDATRNSKPEVVQAIREIASKQKPEAVIAALAALRDRPDSLKDLPFFDFPVQVIVGEEDATTPMELAETMADYLPNVTFDSLPNAGHLSNRETPEAFTAAVLRWLEDLQVTD